jgi:hypothetical protein
MGSFSEDNSQTLIGSAPRLTAACTKLRDDIVESFGRVNGSPCVTLQNWFHCHLWAIRRRMVSVYMPMV